MIRYSILSYCERENREREFVKCFFKTWRILSKFDSLKEKQKDGVRGFKINKTEGYDI